MSEDVGLPVKVVAKLVLQASRNPMGFHQVFLLPVLDVELSVPALMSFHGCSPS